jgi:hypothetical protein
MKEATSPAGAPLCGLARITLPTNAGTWFTPFGHWYAGDA